MVHFSNQLINAFLGGGNCEEGGGGGGGGLGGLLGAFGGGMSNRLDLNTNVLNNYFEKTMFEICTKA